MEVVFKSIQKLIYYKKAKLEVNTSKRAVYKCYGVKLNNGYKDIGIELVICLIGSI